MFDRSTLTRSALSLLCVCHYYHQCIIWHYLPFFCSFVKVRKKSKLKDNLTWNLGCAFEDIDNDLNASTMMTSPMKMSFTCVFVLPCTLVGRLMTFLHSEPLDASVSVSKVKGFSICLWNSLPEVIIGPPLTSKDRGSLWGMKKIVPNIVTPGMFWVVWRLNWWLTEVWTASVGCQGAGQVS